jgi:TrmH family RNA methyltransferase
MGALSINQKKLIRSLSRKKDRNEQGMFLVEGDKMVREVLQSPPGSIPFRVESVAATGEWLKANEKWLGAIGGTIPGGTDIFEVSAAELRQISTLQEPNLAIAVLHQAEYTPDPAVLKDSLSIGLESIRDPGNLGTIIRTADWFGIRDILCSEDCVDLYNPKVIQSTMGSFLRVRLHYLGLAELIGRLRATGGSAGKAGDAGVPAGDAAVPAGDVIPDAGYEVFATGSTGEDLRGTILHGRGLILLGNESRGLSEGLIRCADRLISIPWQDDPVHPDSLNVAAATAIFCFEFRRQAFVGRSQGPALRADQ